MKKTINFKDISSENPKIKYGCVKKLLTLSKNNPGELYPHLDFFVELLDNENNIMKWTAIDIIGRMSKVDSGNKIDKLMAKLFRLLNGGAMITANHAVAALTDIALARPRYQERITEELLKVEHYDYDTVECRNIALGKVILAIGEYFDQLKDKKTVIEFVERQTKNTRNATKKKAEQFLKKWDKK